MLEISIERMEPERLLFFRWPPEAVAPGLDDAAEPTPEAACLALDRITAQWDRTLARLKTTFEREGQQ